MAMSEKLDGLLEQPQESLAVELKGWLDLTDPIDQAKVVKTMLAMRNNNGGLLIIGIDNESLETLPHSSKEDVVRHFNVDDVQSLVTRYASESFEVRIEYPERDGQTLVAIEAPPGVETPVVCKSDLFASRENNVKVLTCDCIYVRTLDANNVPSSSQARLKDWRSLVKRCFDNREADVGAFLRRHVLTADGLTALRDTFQSLPELALSNSSDQTIESSEDQLNTELARMDKVLEERRIELPFHGAREYLAIVKGNFPGVRANEQLLRLLSSVNPRFTGWPPWTDTSGADRRDVRPYVRSGGWERLVADIESGWDIVDFWRIDPRGRFYQYRALQDDIGPREPNIPPGKYLDFGLQIHRTAEVMAVLLSFMEALEVPSNSEIGLACRVSRLSGRQLSSWASRNRYITPGRHCSEDTVVSEVSIPIETPASALAPYVREAVAPVFLAFEGMEIDDKIYEDFVSSMLSRSW